MRRPESLQDYMEMFLRRKWSFLVVFLSITPFALLLAFILPDIYRSTTLILIEPQKVPEAFVKPTITTKVEDRLKTTSQQILSRTKLEKVIQEYGLYQGSGRTSWFEAALARIPVVGSYWNYTALSLDAAVERMKKDIEVTIKGQNVFTVSFQAGEPEITRRVTDKVASLFIEENLKVREQQAEGTSDFLENELNNSRRLLEEHEDRIKDFKQVYMGELPQQLEANLRALDRFQLELRATDETLKATADRKESIEKLLADSGVGSSSHLARLEQLRSKLSQLQVEYKEDYPDIALTRKEIREIEEILSKEEKSSKKTGQGGPAFQAKDRFTQDLIAQLRDLNLETSVLRARRENLTKQIALFERRVENTPLREQQLMTIMRDYANIQNNYQSLLNKRLEAKISENLEKRQKGEIFRVVDPANYPTSPYMPNRFMFVWMGVLIAAAGGAGLVFVRENMDSSFATEADLSEALGIPVLIAIPHQPSFKKGRAVAGRQVSRTAYKVTKR